MSAPTIIIIVGHVLDKLRTLPDASVQMCCTSPPYWGLRDYSRCGCAIHIQGTNGLSIPGNSGAIANKAPDPNCPKCHGTNCPKCHGTGKDDTLTVIWDAVKGCEHEWGAEINRTRETWGHGPSVPVGKNPQSREDGVHYDEISVSAFCLKCNAWRGQLGLEPTVELYVTHIVAVFREVRRVLRDDGTLWLNMGDCYAGSGKGAWDVVGPQKEVYVPEPNGPASQIPKVPAGLKPKDMVGMPWRVAFALQADGWWLRSDIIWAKPNPMPESVTDRPTKAHEYVFLLTKKANYFFDADAVREPNHESSIERAKHHLSNPIDNPDYSGKQFQDYKKYPLLERMNPSGRNLRTVWTIPTAPYPEAHFATFPPKLVESCIKAGTSEKGCCATCGTPLERVLGGKIDERGKNPLRTPKHEQEESMGLEGEVRIGSKFGGSPGWRKLPYAAAKTIGFRPTCDHGGDPIPCTVLDPFAGSGTVGQVARGLGRSAILIEIKEEYAVLAAIRSDHSHLALETFAEDP